jgi:DNA (cytosine-5)-methyltransferase 1
MGYKLAGYDVVGCNDIDERMMRLYRENHKPRYSFCESIQSFKERSDLPKELFDLDILDGSPPCSSFSISGNREDDWGVERKFVEGQEKQILDTLFFDFIDLADKLRPKAVVAENVMGLLMGEAKAYVIRIYEHFEKIGYSVQHFVLNAADMGVPQKRERVFFVALRNDLCGGFLSQVDMFTYKPKLSLSFKANPIPFKEIEERGGVGCMKMYPSIKKHWERTQPGESFSESHKRETSKRGWFNYAKTHPDKTLATITAHTEGGGEYHYSECRSLSRLEVCKAGSFPLDYNFLDQNPKYVVGMSVPPLMIAGIAFEIYEQWLSKIKTPVETGVVKSQTNCL